MTRIDRASAAWAFNVGRDAPKGIPADKACIFDAASEHARWWRAGWNGEPFVWAAK